MIDVRPLSGGEGELADLAELLGATFAEVPHLDVSYLRWCYRENPTGTAIGRNAWDGDRLVAHYVAVPLRARLFGAERRGMLSLHTATRPSHQGQGLFTRLAEATYADAAAAGYDFVVGVANAASTPGFVRRLGFQLVAPLDVRLGLGAPAPTGPEAALDFERLWSEDELAWRLRCPARGYRRAADDGGITVYAPTGRLGIWVEIASRPMAECAPGSALARLPALGLKNPLRLWMGLDASRRWAGRPWTTLPGWARPSPLNLIFRDLPAPGRTLDPGRVRFAAIDFDAY